MTEEEFRDLQLFYFERKLSRLGLGSLMPLFEYLYKNGTIDSTAKARYLYDHLKDIRKRLLGEDATEIREFFPFAKTVVLDVLSDFHRLRGYKQKKYTNPQPTPLDDALESLTEEKSQS